jgi:hypothetical protein
MEDDSLAVPGSARSSVGTESVPSFPHLQLLLTSELLCDRVIEYLHEAQN